MSYFKYIPIQDSTLLRNSKFGFFIQDEESLEILYSCT